MQLTAGFTTQALEAGRDRFNAAFAAARKAGTPVDAQAFTAHIAHAVAPTIEAIGAIAPERVKQSLEALYDVSLDLFKAGLLGPAAKSSAVSQLWQTLFPAIAHVLQRDPRRLCAALSNAAHQIATTPGIDPVAAPQAWLSELARLAPHCQSPQDFLECGKYAAWRSGMAHYRKGAILALRTLATPLATAALNLPAGLSTAALGQAIDRLLADLWLDPAMAHAPPARTLRLIGHMGAFRGFAPLNSDASQTTPSTPASVNQDSGSQGGEFLRPPTVWLSGGGLFATDGESAWRILADIHGRLLIRHGDKPVSAPAPQSATLSVSRQGIAIWDGQQIQIPDIAAVSSFACDGHTLAVTTHDSHHIFLLARTAPPHTHDPGASHAQ
jgi:hypothetical protein